MLLEITLKVAAKSIVADPAAPSSSDDHCGFPVNTAAKFRIVMCLSKEGLIPITNLPSLVLLRPVGTPSTNSEKKLGFYLTIANCYVTETRIIVANRNVILFIFL